MKVFPLLVGTAVAGVLGYFCEPSLRSQLTGITTTPVLPGAEPTADFDALAAAAEAGLDLASLTASQLPKTVILKEETQFSDESSGLTINVAAGSPVKPIRIEGKNVAVRPGATAYTTIVPISKTDLVEQLIANPPAPPEPEVPETPVEPEPEPEVVPDPEPEVAVEPAPEPAPEAAPELAVTPEEEPEAPEAMPEFAEEPQPEPEPEVTPTPKPRPAPVTQAAGGSTNLVTVMQESIRNGQVKEFTFAQVLEWKPAATETVDGEQFQTGLISYKAETIFGVKTIQAKALIKDGRVQRWIWPKSGMEIK